MMATTRSSGERFHPDWLRQCLTSAEPPFLSIAVRCGFRAFLILRAYYPTDLARGFGPFVDLLLTRAFERKKPPGGRPVMS
jgi:hypothetical protein